MSEHFVLRYSQFLPFETRVNTKGARLRKCNKEVQLGKIVGGSLCNHLAKIIGFHYLM